MSIQRCDTHDLHFDTDMHTEGCPACARVERMQGWQPMGTAPKDRNVLLWDGEAASEGGWITERDQTMEEECGAMMPYWWNVRGTSERVTHWQPLPNGPDAVESNVAHPQNGESNALPVVGKSTGDRTLGHERRNAVEEGSRGERGACRDELRASGPQCGSRAAGDEAGRSEVTEAGRGNSAPAGSAPVGARHDEEPADYETACFLLRAAKVELASLRAGGAPKMARQSCAALVHAAECYMTVFPPTTTNRTSEDAADGLREAIAAAKEPKQ